MCSNEDRLNAARGVRHERTAAMKITLASMITGEP